MSLNLSFFSGRRVLVTGHTGFKGSWLARTLIRAGADVTGLSLPVSEANELYTLLRLEDQVQSVYGDVRNPDDVRRAFALSRPEVVLHLAAQPLVIDSYRDPAYTYGVNVMGTVNVLEAVRLSEGVETVVNVTTDKVYENKEWVWSYRETERLNGHDPYSNSKSCSELVTDSFVKSFLRARGIAVSTARAGNVIGGGDFAENRIVPDCVRAAQAGETIKVRNPHSVRPYQHVLEPLSAYLLIASRQALNPDVAGPYNVGPEDADNITTGALATEFCRSWGEGLTWSSELRGERPHEAGLLRLDSSKLKATLGWEPRWSVREAIGRVVEWTKVHMSGEDIATVTDRQIDEYFGETIA